MSEPGTLRRCRRRVSTSADLEQSQGFQGWRCCRGRLRAERTAMVSCFVSSPAVRCIRHHDNNKIKVRNWRWIRFLFFTCAVLTILYRNHNDSTNLHKRENGKLAYCSTSYYTTIKFQTTGRYGLHTTMAFASSINLCDCTSTIISVSGST